MSNKDDLSDEDRELFRKAMQHTKPLRCRTTVASESFKLSKSPGFIATHPKAETTAPDLFYLSSYLRERVQPETILSFSRPAISKKQFNSLKKGEYPIDAVLDLHGQTPLDAENALRFFIATQFQQQRRHVLIIHGKGGRRGEPPVIKNLVYCWLPQFPQVLAFHSALAKQGGAGALYVLLRRTV